MNLKFKCKLSSEIKGSNKDCVRPYRLGSSITTVWSTIFLTEKKIKMEEELKNGETKNTEEEA